MSIEKALFFDPQAAPHAALCRRCGGALYRPTLCCVRCERSGHHDPAGDE